MRRLAIALAALALVGSAATVVLLVRAGGDEGDAVPVPERSAARSGDASAGDRDEDPGLRPRPGTYVYEGTGSESVDVLTGSRHVFPARYPAEVTLDEGCEWSMHIPLVQQHVIDEHFCTSAEGVVELGYETAVEFFDISEKDEWKCPRQEDPWRLRTRARPGQEWSWVCASEDADFARTASLVGIEEVVVDARAVRAWHVHLTGELTGSKEGTSTFDYWLAASGLPLRWKVTRAYEADTVLGHTGYEQRLAYTIASLEPR